MKTELLKYNPISSSNIVLGFMICNSGIKKFTGIYNSKQNTTEILSYETY
jgi:hypothetical protein